LTRTRRWIALVGVYLFFGFTGPIIVTYMGTLLESIGNVEVVLPDPVPADGMANYASNAAQVGLLVSVGMAAAALAFDSNPQMGTFLRTRVESIARIITPRYVTITSAIAVSFTAGSLAAYYETTVLIGSLPFGRWLLGTLLGCLYLAFAVAVVAAVMPMTRTVMPTVVAALVVLLLFPIVGLIPNVGAWLPSHLVGALDGLVRGIEPTEYLKAAVTTIIATAALLAISVRTSQQRSIK
jgi:ABC-2 type transport system permease protein